LFYSTLLFIDGTNSEGHLNIWQHVFYSKSDMGKKMIGHIWLAEDRNSSAQMLCTLIDSQRCWWRTQCPKVSAAISFFFQRMDIMKLQDYNPSLCTPD
jgi:hypothetical protein